MASLLLLVYAVGLLPLLVGEGAISIPESQLNDWGIFGLLEELIVLMIQ